MARSRTTWQPGESGNLNGRPVGAFGWKRRLWDQAIAEAETAGSLSEATAEAIISAALSGDIDAMYTLILELLDRRDALDDALFSGC
jgi:hypothetical protein